MKREAFDAEPALLDPLIWRDAVLVTARAIGERAERAFKDARLEPPLLSAMELIGDLGTQGSRRADERQAIVAAFALGDLSENADRSYFREYASDIALNLVEIGLFALEHSLNSTDGEPLAKWISTELVANLRTVLQYPMHEAVYAGRFDPASHQSRWAFVKQVGVAAGDNFGFRFDPVTGVDYPPVT